MSVEPQALERSVLERKERDELAAIAEAMGVKAGARTSKANLIGQILREAGIETENDEKPKRAAKPKSENGAANGEVAAEAVAATEADSAESPSDPPAKAEVEAEQPPADEQAQAETTSEADPQAEQSQAPNQERQGGRGNQQAYGGVAII